MEINLIRRQIPVWQTEKLPAARTTLSAESVIPDTCQDVSRILSVRGELLLKGKEPGPEGMSVLGEGHAAVLFLCEDGKTLGVQRFEKPFRVDFACPLQAKEAMPAVNLRLDALDARILNPRRLAVDFALTTEMTAFTRDELVTEDALPEGEWKGLHLRFEETEALALTSLCDKGFTLREQFPVPEGTGAPEQLAGEEIRFQELHCEQIGDRAILKGEMQLRLWGLTAEGEPAEAAFSSAFSQLLETGEGSLDQTELSVLPCAFWYDWREGADGGLTLDAEVRAAAQLQGWSRVKLRSCTDAYSTCAPCACSREKRSAVTRLEREKALYSVSARLPMPADLPELLAVWPGLALPVKEGESVSLPMDLICRDADHVPAAARRVLELTGTPLPQGAEELGAELIRMEAHPAGEELSLRAEAEIAYRRETREELACVSGIRVDEDAPPSDASSCSLTMVRRGGEELWDLAKRYGSSVELIESCNEPEAELLLIPRERA